MGTTDQCNHHNNGGVIFGQRKKAKHWRGDMEARALIVLLEGQRGGYTPPIGLDSHNGTLLAAGGNVVPHR